MAWFMFCECRGSGCERCKDSPETGAIGMHRCPLKLVEAAGGIGLRVAKAFRLFQHYDMSGNLPVSGGTAEQSCTLMRIFEIAGHERGRILSDRQKNSSEEAKARAGGWR